jgi:chromosomal replication initiation ATPase DnaA
LRLAARSRPFAVYHRPKPVEASVALPMGKKPTSVFEQILTLVGDDKSYSASDIIMAVSTVMNIPISEIRGFSRVRRVSKARQLVSSLCIQFTGQSSTWIGKLIKKDHSSVLHGRDIVAADPEYFMPLREQVLAILNNK